VLSFAAFAPQHGLPRCDSLYVTCLLDRSTGMQTPSFMRLLVGISTQACHMKTLERRAAAMGRASRCTTALLSSTRMTAGWRGAGQRCHCDVVCCQEDNAAAYEMMYWQTWRYHCRRASIISRARSREQTGGHGREAGGELSRTVGGGTLTGGGSRAWACRLLSDYILRHTLPR